MQLKGKKIVLAVTGSIAAYKALELVRQFVKAGAEVKVLITSSAASFVSPLALATVSKHPVLSNVSDGASWNNHVELGRWADAMLIAPCSANTLSKLAHGLCDNLVCAVYLSAACPVFIAPAMDEDMWFHPSTVKNLETVKSFGNYIIPVAHGELASGLIGEGRMAEPSDMVAYLSDYFHNAGHQPLKGTNVLVTAGPTYERLDPVRFIGNFSTGKMGIALADALAAKGANVMLVLGPTHLKPENSSVTTISVESASEMYEASTEIFPSVGIAILAAAVADYKPENKAAEKIKKTEETFHLNLVKNKDILATLGSMKKEGQLLAGFALETTNEEEHAWNKLRAKNADLIVLNSLKDDGAGFGHDTNKITLLDVNGNKKAFPLQTKLQAAEAIVNHILALRHVEANN